MSLKGVQSTRRCAGGRYPDALYQSHADLVELLAEDPREVQKRRIADEEKRLAWCDGRSVRNLREGETS